VVRQAWAGRGRDGAMVLYDEGREGMEESHVEVIAHSLLSLPMLEFWGFTFLQIFSALCTVSTGA
jgi:hypothetical protein